MPCLETYKGRPGLSVGDPLEAAGIATCQATAISRQLASDRPEIGREPRAPGILPWPTFRAPTPRSAPGIRPFPLRDSPGMVGSTKTVDLETLETH